MKTFKLIIQTIGIFIMVYISISIVPNMARSEVYRSYSNDHLLPLIDSPNSYLEELSSFNNYTYQKTPLFTIDDSNGVDRFSSKAYLLASNVDSYYNNGIFIFIKEAESKGLSFEQLSLTVYYDKPIRTSGGESVNYLDPLFITKNSSLQGFYISNYFFSENEVAKITALKFGIKIGESTSNEFLIISNDYELEDLSYSFSHKLSDLSIDLENNNLSSLINDPTNIPTQVETDSLNLYYSKFDHSKLSKYTYIYWLWQFYYLLLISPIIYFGYVRSLLKLRKMKL